MKKVTLLALNLFVGWYVTAQVTVNSPDVASLNRYIDFPVSKSTGTANVDIPIYTIEAGGFKLPISLAYHTGGIKVDAMAGCAGLGWAINAGGVISRSIKSYPDEGGYYGIGGFTVTISDYEYIVGDSEPDVFTFNFNGYSGKFLFDKYQQVHLIPEQDIKITVEGNSESDFGKFTLSTADGSKYIFEDVYDYFETIDGLSPSPYNTAIIPNAWHLSKIITPTLEEITFEYQSDGYETRINAKDAVSAASNTGACASCYTRPVLNRVQGNAITKISSRTSEVVFTYKSTLREDINSGYGSAKAMDYIEIKDKFFNTVVKKFQLSTSYFQSNDNLAIGSVQGSNQVTSYTVASYLQKRLRLDSIQEFSPNGNPLPAYKFYYNKHNPVSKTPNRLSNGQDHWGYYNGVSTNVCLISYYQWPSGCSTSTNLADRFVRQGYNKAYILDEIIFPTGGVTQFNYDNPTDSLLIPGVRLKEVINKTGATTVATKKNFSYGNIYLTGGVPVYAQLYPFVEASGPWSGNPYNRIGTQSIGNTECLLGNGALVVSENAYLAFPNPANYNGELAGNYAYYDQVTEHQPDNGSIESYYSTSEIEDYIMDLEFYPLIFSKPALNAGKIIKETFKREDGTIIKEANYTYNYYYRRIIVDSDAARLIRQPCASTLKYYPIYTGYSYLKEKEDVSYLKSSVPGSSYNTFSTKVTYDYERIPVEYRNGSWVSNPYTDYGLPVHHLVTKQTTTQSDGATIITAFKYPHDFTGETLYNTMATTRHMLQQVIEQSTYKGVDHLQSNKTNYYDWGSNLITPQSTQTKKSADAYETKFMYYSYDDKGNPLSYSKQDDAKTSYVWGYNKSLPVVKAENVNSTDLNTKVDQALVDIGYTNGLSDLDVFLASIGKMTTNGQKASWIAFNTRLQLQFSNDRALVTTTSHSPMIGITCSTDVNRISTYYEYDEFNRLSVVRDNSGNIVKTYCYNYQGQPTNCQ